MVQKVYSFWFEEVSPEQWFNGGAEFDDLIKQKFNDLLVQASAGELFEWRNTARGRLAEIIVLDQFSRNVYRNSPDAFSNDGMALVLAQEAVRSGTLEQLSNENERSFLLMPYMHSESKRIHEIAIPLFKEYATETSYEFGLKHKAIIDRFGRYPHRNAAIGRKSSAEELEFLTQPGSSF